MKAETTSTMPTGWSWLCPCGWATGRHTDLAEIDHRRHAHRAWHSHTARAGTAA